MINWTRRFVGVSAAVTLICSTAMATDLNVSVTSGGSNAITVDPCGGTVDYEVSGVLSDSDNLGMAGFVFGLEFSGGPLGTADAPSADPMLNFDRPAGMTAAGGFGGTVVDARLVHVGGSQNTPNNTPDNAPFPIGTVITGVAHTETVLVTGTVTAPVEPGTYTLTLSNLAATVIVGDDQGTGYWVVEPAGAGTIGNLTVVVLPADPPATASNDGPACEGDAVTLLGGPDGMAGYSWTGPGGFTSTQQNPVISLPLPGIYTLTVTDSNDCIDATRTTVALLPGTCDPFVDCDSNDVHDGCEADTDEDGLIDGCDNCPNVANPGQEDGDGDGIGNACENDDPTCDADGPYAVAEGGTVQLDASGSSDPNQPTDTLTFEWDLDDDDIFGETGADALRGDELGIDPIYSPFGLGGPSTEAVTLRVTDDGGATVECTADINISNVSPVIVEASPAAQDVQYSDPIADVTIAATDVMADTLTATMAWSVDGGGPTPGLPSGLVLNDEGCSVTGNTKTCVWTLTGIADVPVGVYTIQVTVTDNDGGATETDVTITVSPEDAALAFDSGNPVAVQVDEPDGDSGPFSLTVYVSETQPDQSAVQPALSGDISHAVVSMTLGPVGPGASVVGTCVPVGVSGSGYDAVLTVACDFDDVPVNTYAVQATVAGGYYGGELEDVLVVFDPSLGFTTGGGWFYWPGTEDPSNGYAGDRTNAGYTMKYKRNLTRVRGSLLLIRHLADGTIFRIKSNVIFGMAIGEEGGSDPFGWASFSGKCTYLEPGWPEPEGNYRFVTYVEDHGEPGAGADRFWVELRDRDSNVVLGLSMADPATDNAVTIEGGNIVVPHDEN